MKKKKSLKKFKVKEVPKFCSLCFIETKKRGSIRIHTTNAWKTYKNSNVGLTNIYSLKLCEKCFDKIIERFNKAIFN